MGGGGGGRLFEAGRLLTFSAFRMGAYSRWVLIRGWALIRINTVVYHFFCKGPDVAELLRNSGDNDCQVKENQVRHEPSFLLNNL